MAVVNATFTRSRADARAEVRYIVHRPERDGREGNRTLFNSDGDLTERDAYRLIREAEKGTVFFKIVISPDPNGEDTKRDLSLSDVTIQTMLTLQERLNQPVHFVAAEHDNTDVRHVHVLALVRSFVNEKTLQACIDAATQTARFQRQERDLAQGQQPQQRVHLATAHRRPTGRAATPRGQQPAAGTARLAKPALTGQTCPSCGYTQPKSAAGRKHTCHCSACGYQLHRSHSLKLQREGVSLQR